MMDLPADTHPTENRCQIGKNKSVLQVQYEKTNLSSMYFGSSDWVQEY